MSPAAPSPSWARTPTAYTAGLATLQMMFSSFSGRYLLPVTIEDYSNSRFRGFVEGFYGGFDYVGRESQMRSIRDVKGNMYPVQHHKGTPLPFS